MRQKLLAATQKLTGTSGPTNGLTASSTNAYGHDDSDGGSPLRSPGFPGFSASDAQGSPGLSNNGSRSASPNVGYSLGSSHNKRYPAGALAQQQAGRDSRDSMLRASGGSGMESAKQGTLERRQELKDRRDTPLMHIEARHAQAERAAKELVEDALLQHGGLAAFRYVEG